VANDHGECDVFSDFNAQPRFKFAEIVIATNQILIFDVKSWKPVWQFGPAQRNTVPVPGEPGGRVDTQILIVKGMPVRIGQ